MRREAHYLLAGTVLVELVCEVVLELVLVEDAQKDGDDLDQNALQAAHVGKDIENGVAGALNDEQAEVKLDVEALHQVLLVVGRDLAALLQGENARVRELGDVIEIHRQVLQEQMRLLHLVHRSLLPKPHVVPVIQAFHHNGVFAVRVLVESDLIFE